MSVRVNASRTHFIHDCVSCSPKASLKHEEHKVSAAASASAAPVVDSEEDIEDNEPDPSPAKEIYTPDNDTFVTPGHYSCGCQHSLHCVVSCVQCSGPPRLFRTVRVRWRQCRGVQL